MQTPSGGNLHLDWWWDYTVKDEILTQAIIGCEFERSYHEKV